MFPLCVRVQGELAMTAGKLDVAQQCLVRAKDFSGLLLMRRLVWQFLKIGG